MFFSRFSLLASRFSLLASRFSLTHGTLAALALLTLAALPQVAQAQNLVLNPGFETGTFANWTKTGNTSLSDVISNAATIHTGSFGYRGGQTTTAGGITQTISTLTGHSYTFSYWLKNSATSFTAQSFDASWNGTSVQSLLNSGAMAYTEFSFTVIATGTSTPISFSFRNDPSFWRFDDVSVTHLSAAAPEPGTLALLALGIVGGVVARRRK